MTLMVLGAGLSAIAQNTYGLDDGNARANKRQKSMSAWQKDMDEFKARSAHDRQLNALADSLASVQGRAALVNQDFVLAMLQYPDQKLQFLMDDIHIFCWYSCLVQ